MLFLRTVLDLSKDLSTLSQAAVLFQPPGTDRLRGPDCVLCIPRTVCTCMLWT